METITLRTSDGQDVKIPIAHAFGPDGKPAELIGDIEPQNCDHAGACWSSCLDMRCTRCGSRLFIPPRHLARRPEEIIEDMHRLWCAAGWPEFVGGKDGHWSIVPGKWTVIQHPLFAHVGGLPVRHDKLAGYTLAADSYPPRGNGHQPGVEVRQ